LERTTVDENDIVTAVLNNPDAQDALRVIARIAIREVALRANSSPPVEDVTVIGDMTIDRLRHTVSVDGAIRSTKPREFALLETLARRPGIVFSRGRLMDLAWPDPEGVDDERTVDVHIRRLRAKLGAAANIRTVHGVGYTLDPPKAD
jgi:two-component system response regulator ChvI